jgi:shikimate dehydrogenase
MPAVFTLADLETWSRPGTSLAVLGHPIKHSISPQMHNAALGVMARVDPRFSAWEYFRFEVAPDDLPRALDLLHAKKFRGVNLTVPHKILAFSRVASVDPAAQPIGAVNTLLWKQDGWHGFNTDGYGLASAIRADLKRDLDHAAVILLGAGGAARGAAVECLQRRCAELWIGNRTQANLDALLADLRTVAGGIPLRGFDPQHPPADLPAGAIVINATSAGLKGTDTSPLDLTRIPRPAAVYDMIYNPPQTPFLAQAARLGIAGANGLSMLIHQGARALEIWSATAVPVAAMRAAAHGALNG